MMRILPLLAVLCVACGSGPGSAAVKPAGANPAMKAAGEDTAKALASGGRAITPTGGNAGMTPAGGDRAITLAGLKKNWLGAAVGSLPAIAGWAARDTVLEGDEGVTWKGRAWYSGRQLVLLAETNWEDSQRVHRITVFGPQIREGALFVGQRMKDIGGLISGTLPSGPDGYLFLELKSDSAISVQLDVSGLPANSPLLEGVSEITRVPDSLRVESIVIMGEVPRHVGGIRPAVAGKSK